MGVDRELARGAVRFSLGAGNTEQDIGQFVQALKGLVKRLKDLTAMAV
jgi:cysteine desulfurase